MPWTLSNINPNIYSLWRLSPRESLSPMSTGRISRPLLDVHQLATLSSRCRRQEQGKETANFDILTYKAPRTYDTSRECKDSDSDLDDFPVPVSVLTTRLLESLGWQKIRYDVREHLPTVYRRVRYPVLSSSNCWVASVIPARRFPWDIPCWWPIPRANSPST
jgi:hypothetical protein